MCLKCILLYVCCASCSMYMYWSVLPVNQCGVYFGASYSNQVCINKYLYSTYDWTDLPILPARSLQYCCDLIKCL